MVFRNEHHNIHYMCEYIHKWNVLTKFTIIQSVRRILIKAYQHLTMIFGVYNLCSIDPV